MSRRLFALAVTLSILAAQPPCFARDAPAVTLGRVPDGGQMIAAARGPNHSIHLLFQKNNAPFYALSADGGNTTSPPIPVITSRISQAGLEFLGWDLAISDTGKVFVVMSNNAWKLKLPQDQWGMYMATLEPDAKAFGPTIALNGVSSTGFAIAAGKNGDVASAFIRQELYWKYSTDDGKTFSANAPVDTDYLPCNCCTTSLAYGRDGTLALLYREASGNRRDIFAVLFKDGKHVRVPVSHTLWMLNACPMTYFKIAPAGDGFVAAWPTRGEVYFTRLSSAGKIWAPGEIKVGGKTAMRSSIFALAGKNDTTLVAWKSDDTLHWRLYDANGKPLGNETTAPGAGAQSGGVVDKDGNYILFP